MVEFAFEAFKQTSSAVGRRNQRHAAANITVCCGSDHMAMRDLPVAANGKLGALFDGDDSGAVESCGVGHEGLRKFRTTNFRR